MEDKRLGITLTSAALRKIYLASGILVGIVVFGVIALLASLWYQSGHFSLRVDNNELRISPGLFSRTIPAQDIETGGVKVVDLTVEKGYQPKTRDNGASFGGFLVGWFTLQDNEKALLFLKDRSNVVYIPTNQGYSILISASNAADMAKQIRSW